jgi:hypothetical protein
MNDVPKGLEVTAAKVRELIETNSRRRHDRRRWILDVVSERLLIRLLDSVVEEALKEVEGRNFSWSADDIWEIAVDKTEDAGRFSGNFADECNSCLDDIGIFLRRSLCERGFQTDVSIGSKALTVHKNNCLYSEMHPSLDIRVAWVAIE